MGRKRHDKALTKVEARYGLTTVMIIDCTQCCMIGDGYAAPAHKELNHYSSNINTYIIV